MKIRNGDQIIKADLTDCFLTVAEAAAISGKSRQNYIQYIGTNKAAVITHPIGDESMYSLKEVAEDARKMIAEEMEAKMAVQSGKFDKDKNELLRKLKNREVEVAKLRTEKRTLQTAKPQVQMTPSDRQRMELELLAGQVELDKARLRKFNLTNEKIVLQLKEICKQELFEAIGPIIARLDQALSPHATEVHQILHEMLLSLQTEVAFNELGEEENSLMNEAKQDTDLDAKTP